MKILSNQIRCTNCGDEPFSANRHDFKWCECGGIAVDGGMEYLRRVGDGAFTDMSITISDELYEELQKTLAWVKETKRNDLGLLCAIFRTLRDHDVLKEYNQ